MYFIFTSFFNYKYYFVYGVMLLVFCILLVVSLCVSIVGTYCLLNAEDHRWPWVSLLTGASVGGYMWLYAVYYYLAKTKMTGFFQTSYFFGYMLMFCVGMALVCGAVGFISSGFFVRRIFRSARTD